MLEESFNQRGICSLDQSLDKRQKTKDSPFTEHIEEYIDVDGEEEERDNDNENEKRKTKTKTETKTKITAKAKT